MRFAVLTIFPDMFNSFLEHGIIKRAIQRDKISVSAINIRDFAKGKHKITDDSPYGGGCGMVMKPEPIIDAILFAKSQFHSAKTIFLTPQGRVFNQETAVEFASSDALILICGRYEGVDERVCEHIDYEISIGDYVMTGGELAAMVVIDATTRLIPNVLGGTDSAQKDSFSNGFLKYAQYTRPQSFDGLNVPQVLLSGNHSKIEKWRLESALIRTFLKRQDLLEAKSLNEQEIKLLKKWRLDIDTIIQTQSLHSSDALSSNQQTGERDSVCGNKP